MFIPALRLNPRIKDGFDSRRSTTHLHPSDLWMQAASAGEAYLANAILNEINPSRPLKIFITTNTRQGLDILNKGIEDIPADRPITANASYCPFDRPAIMNAAVQKINPRVMALLETEIWPGLLAALKKNKSGILIINGRLTPKSLRGYIKFKKVLQRLAPDRILAISEADAQRFARLFGPDRIGIMPNIKFDRLNPAINPDKNSLDKIIPANSLFLVLGSIRQEEEPFIENIVADVHNRLPETVISIFPRHMNRMNHWTNKLMETGMKWRLRSELTKNTVDSGTIVLWDVFGELNHAYARANAVFVGGSLAPLGGQNFLEPLIFGIRPVIGPYWDNFAWVGDDVFSQKLVIKTQDWRTASAELIASLKYPETKETVQNAAIRYINERKGGTQQACRLILQELESKKGI